MTADIIDLQARSLRAAATHGKRSWKATRAQAQVERVVFAALKQLKRKPRVRVQAVTERRV